MKELLTYWCAVPRWKRLWPVIKLCRTVPELLSLFPRSAPNAQL